MIASETRVLPAAGERSTISSWAAIQAMSADLRARSVHYRDLAAQLIVVGSEVYEGVEL